MNEHGQSAESTEDYQKKSENEKYKEYIAESIADYKELEWVDKTGLVFLNLVSEKGEVNFPLGDLLTIIIYIRRNATKHLTSLLIDMLNTFEKQCPAYMNDISSLTYYYEKSNISQRKSLASVLNPVLRAHKPEIIEHIQWFKNQKFRVAFEGLYTMALYAMTNEIPNPELVRETIRIIELKLPPVNNSHNAQTH